MKSKLATYAIAILVAGIFALPLSVDAKYMVPSQFQKAQPAALERHEDPRTVALCPVSGKPADTSKFILHEGRKVSFCCAKCEEPFKNDPGKYLHKGNDTSRAPGHHRRWNGARS